MVEVKKSKWTQLRFRLMQKNRLQQAFHKLYVKSGYMPNEAIFVVNHSGWWDALVLFELEQKKQIPPVYTMMDEELLQQYPIFSKNGAFSVQLHEEEQALKAFQYADLLLTDGKSVALFPQGTPKHQDERPLQFVSSVVRLFELCRDIPIIPVAIYYTHRHEQKGEVWVSLGDPIYTAHTEVMPTEELEERLTEQLDLLRQDAIANKIDAYKNVLAET